MKRATVQKNRKFDHRPKAVIPAGNVLSVISIGSLAAFVGLILLLLLADIVYLAVNDMTVADVVAILLSKEVSAAIRLSLVTSTVTLLLVIATSLPVGYALSRYRCPAHSFLNTVVDVPIVLPPVVIGVSLLAFFGGPMGRPIKQLLLMANVRLVSSVGIVMCQYLVSVGYCIRAMKAAFDGVDRELEDVALSLGCSPPAAFCRVTLPLAASGLLAGSIMAWARAIGVFGPLMVFVGTSPRVKVVPTTMWLELSIGNIEVALATALLTVLMAGIALAFVHRLAPDGMNR